MRRAPYRVIWTTLALIAAPAAAKQDPEFGPMAQELCNNLAKEAAENEGGESRPMVLTHVDEVVLGRQFADEFEQENATAPSARLDSIGRKVAEYCDRPQLNFSFRAVRMPGVLNAFSLPAGHIYVTEEMLKPDFFTDAELAAILGHEVAHAAMRDVANGAMDAGISKFVASQLCKGLDDAKTLMIAVEGLQVQMRFLHQGRELSADQFGVLYAIRAGYELEGALSAMKKLMEKVGDESAFGSAPGQIPSHPPFSVRIAELRKGAEQLQAIAASFDEGRAALAEGRFDDALRIFDSVLSVFPNSQSARLNFGAALHGSFRANGGSSGTALDLLLAENLEPRWNQSLRLRGAKKEFDPSFLRRAVTAYEAILARDPDNVLARNNLAAAYLDEARVDPAIEQLKVAAEREIPSPVVLKNLGIAYLEKCRALAKDPAAPELGDRARESLERYAQLEPTEAKSRALLSLLDRSRQCSAAASGG